LLAEIKKMQNQEQQGQAEMPQPTHEAPVYVPPIQRGPLESQTQRDVPPVTQRSNYGSQAMTNSTGSLALRQTPDMGSQQLNIRVPNKSLLNILEYSENAIILDGKRSRFVLVEYQGQSGWILESYLNFN